MGAIFGQQKPPKSNQNPGASVKQNRLSPRRSQVYMTKHYIYPRKDETLFEIHSQLEKQIASYGQVFCSLLKIFNRKDNHPLSTLTVPLEMTQMTFETFLRKLEVDLPLSSIFIILEVYYAPLKGSA